jgi:hypothetical protein
LDLEDNANVSITESVASIAGDDADEDFFFFFFLKSVLVVKPESKRALPLAATEVAFSSVVMDRFRFLDLLLVEVEATEVVGTLDEFSMFLAEAAVVPDESPFRF